MYEEWQLVRRGCQAIQADGICGRGKLRKIWEDGSDGSWSHEAEFYHGDNTGPKQKARWCAGEDLSHHTCLN